MRENTHIKRTSLLTARSGPRDTDTSSRWFKLVTTAAVLGYVMFNRAFAWVHVPGVPIFVGEVVLFLAVILLLRHQRALIAMLRNSSAMRTAGLLFLWGALRLAFDLPIWGLAALRDGAQTNYILIGLAMAVVVVRQPAITEPLSQLRYWVPATVVVWVPIAILLNRRFVLTAPFVPGSQTSIFSYKPGDYAMFAAAAIAYVWMMGDHYSSRYRNTITFIGVLGLLVAGSQNRGGFLGALGALAIAAIFMQRSRRRRYLSGMALAAGSLILVLAMTNLVIPLGSRAFSVGQLADNAISITGRSGEGGFQGTASWRLEYWRVVVTDVMTGDDWLVGIGFGPSLADDYGYQTEPTETTQPLRNAHNSHVTLIARLGLVGMLLWLIFWFQLALQLYKGVRRRSHPIVGWMMAIMFGIGIAAIFDPVLEGPQMAIPFWCAVGIAASVASRRSIRRTHQAV